MASKKRKSDEPSDSFELKGSTLLSNVPAPPNALKAQTKENGKEKNKRGRANPVVKKLICSYCKKNISIQARFQ